MNKLVLSAVLVAFGAFSAYTVIASGGLMAFLTALIDKPANWQVLIDLVIALSLLLVFIRRDAKATGRPFWPWAIFSLTVGSFGPLLYFITAKKSS